MFTGGVVRDSADISAAPIPGAGWSVSLVKIKKKKKKTKLLCSSIKKIS